jgi:DNA polymerase-3 subunit delta
LGTTYNIFQFIELAYDKIKNNETLLKTHLAQYTLGGGDIVIKIDQLDNNISAKIMDILKGCSSLTNAKIVLTAGNLPPSSNIRNIIEKNDWGAALACYVEQGREARSHIEHFFINNAISYDRDVIDILESKATGNHLYLDNMLNKILLYMGDERRLSSQTTIKLVAESVDYDLDDWCRAFASRNTAKTMAAWHRAMKDGYTPATAIRYLERYFVRLHVVRSHTEHGGKKIDEAMHLLKPPVFFKDTAIFSSHVRDWNLQELSFVLSKLVEIEAMCKQGGNKPAILCERFISSYTQSQK